MTDVPMREEWPKLAMSHELSSADYYFDSRAHYGAYQDMLHDTPSMGSMRKAILQNKHLFRDKTVLVVGCGLSIVPILASQAGASRVFAHTAYAIGDFTEMAAARNNFTNIEMIRGDIRTVSLPVEQVDIILCELGGCFLFYESKLEEYLIARDRFLTVGGLLFPDYAEMCVAGITDYEERRSREAKFRNLWGCDLRDLQEASNREPLIDFVAEENIITKSSSVFTIDLYTAPSDILTQVPVAGQFNIEVSQRSTLGGLVFWFDMYYRSGHVPVWYTTSPHCTATTWKQTVLTLQKALTVTPEDEVVGRFAIRRGKGRELEVKLSYSLGSKSQTEFYRLP